VLFMTDDAYGSASRSFFQSPTVRILAGAALWACAAAYVVFGTKSLIGFDAYYHVEMSQLMIDRGFVIREFPWTTCSIWSDPFFDKEWLFHVCLTPFIAVLGKFDGARTAIVCFAGLAAVSWGVLLRSLGVKRLFLGLLLILFCAGYAFLGRIVLCRPHLFSIIFLPLALALIVRKNGWGLAVVSCLYMLSYVGAWQIIPVAFIFDAAAFLSNRKRETAAVEGPRRSIHEEDASDTPTAGKGGFQRLFGKILGLSTLWTAAGIAAGLLLSPYFPVNLKAIYLQSVLVLTAKWFGAGGGGQVVQAAELAPIGAKHVLTYLLVLVGFAVLVWRFVKENAFRKVRPEASAMIALSGVYLAMTIMSQRFVEYLAPVFAVAAMLYWSERPLVFLKKKHSGGSDAGMRIKALRIVFSPSVFFPILMIAGLFSTVILARSVRDDHLLFEDSSEWIAEHVEPGSLVFSAGWGENSVLFYHLPQYRYLVMLEPYFMYAKSPRKYLMWLKISEGKALDAAGAVESNFDTTTIFVPPSNLKLKYRLLSDDSAELAYEGKSGETIFTIPRKSRF